jgi:hypothetical protein
MIGPLGIAGKILKGIAMLAVGFAAYTAYASLAAIPFVGVALGAVAAAGITAAGMGFLGSIKDGVIDPKKGPVVSGEFGTVQLNPKDSIVAGTNLMPDNKIKNPTSSPQQPQSQAIDYDKMAQAMSRVKVQTNLDGVRVSSELQKAPMGMATRKI